MSICSTVHAFEARPMSSTGIEQADIETCRSALQVVSFVGACAQALGFASTTQLG
jgi:hypothetical protein